MSLHNVRRRNWTAIGSVAALCLVMLWACGRSIETLAEAHRVTSPPATLVLGALQGCDQEDGSGPYQTYPCVWDCLHMGNRQCGQDQRPIVFVRAEDGCPRIFQPTRCVIAPSVLDDVDGMLEGGAW